MTSAAPAITPFWERLPRFFLFPLSTDKLAYLLLLSAASLIGFVLPLPGPLAFAIVECGIWVAAFRHAFRTMDLMAHGYIEPEAQANVVRDDPARKMLPWKMVGLLIVWAFIVGFIQAASGFLGFFASTFVSIAIPAMVMQLCASNDFSESMSPGRWWHYMSRIGWPYLALVLFLFMLMNGAPRALALFIPVLGGPLVVPIANFVLLYFNLIIFALMGYVMYQYHSALGLAVDVQPEAPAEDKPQQNPDAAANAQVGQMLAAGQTQEAVQYCERLVRERPTHWPAHERVSKLLGYLQMTEALREHQKRSFDVAIRLGRMANALALYRELKAADASPTLQAPQVLPMAAAAERERDVALALELTKGFKERFPGHPSTPGVLMLQARIASERQGDDVAARKLLLEILDAWYRDPLAAEAKNYLKVMEKMAGTKPPPSQA